jgi:two-component system LytT family response regulator
MKTLRTLLVDDEPLARNLLRELLADFPAVQVAGECASGPEALAALQAEAYDLVFLDVQMPGFDGVQVMQQLRASGRPLPLVVFVTAYDHYAVSAFALHATDYLLKPLDPDRFADCLARVQERLSQPPPAATTDQLAALLRAWPTLATAPEVPEYQDRFLIKTPERNFFVPAAEVLYIETTDSALAVHTASQQYLLRQPLSQLESRLDPARFLRIHRSYLINTDHIREFKPWAHGEYVFRMANGAHVTSSRSYSAAIQQFLKRFS